MRAVVTGAASGLGKLIADNMRTYAEMYSWDLAHGVDVTNTRSLWLAREHFVDREVDVLVNCAGINHPGYIGALREDEFDAAMAVNAKGILLTMQVLLEQLRGGTICNIISNAATIPMTASLAYNASKAAAHMMTLQMARELWVTHNITVFGVSPNKMHSTGMTKAVDTRIGEMRGWSPEETHLQQLTKMPIGEETDPAAVAEFVGWLLAIKRRHKYLHGCIIPYGA